MDYVVHGEGERVFSWLVEALSEGAGSERLADIPGLGFHDGERLVAEGEICWGGMHSWKRMIEILEGVKPGDLVVTAGVSRIYDGLQVRVPERAGSEPENVAGEQAPTPEPDVTP